jgi:hypothetical protein
MLLSVAEAEAAPAVQVGAVPVHPGAQPLVVRYEAPLALFSP